ncbi:hypothetical protein KSF78_0008436 [Schistosoma japonicum]|nr:hypothetical protein KSF78_0008436 [Schistosoma japonicum]
MQSASGPGTTIVHLSPKNHTILQQKVVSMFYSVKLLPTLLAVVLQLVE